MLLVLLFIALPIAELYVIVQFSHAIGFLNTLGLIILIAIVGSWLIKREGVKVWNSFTSQIQAGKVPSREIADGVCLLMAGALMLTPGFLTDVVALLLLFPPTRALARRWLMSRTGFASLTTGRVIKTTYRRPGAGAPGGDASFTDTTATEIRGEIDRHDD
jgi:UPF0716 protein FxsA